MGRPTVDGIRERGGAPGEIDRHPEGTGLRMAIENRGAFHHFMAVARRCGTDIPIAIAAERSAAEGRERMRLATERAHAGDAVLMSPACASFDMFRDYEHRAEVFRAAVEALADEAGTMLGGDE